MLRFCLKKINIKLKTNTYKHKHPFLLEAGYILPEIELAYQALGTINSDCTNVVWVCHAFTGSQDVEDWWQGLVGRGKLFDPDKHFIICVNVLGSHYGSTGPLSINPETDKPYYHTFPLITIRDIVNSFDILREHLGIHQIYTCIGGSLGGQQSVEWAISQPDLIENLILIATNAQHSPWGIAFNESQRMAIEVDPTWVESNPQAGLKGMSAARATALISYRNYETYGVTQARRDEPLGKSHRAVTYQRYQGEKLAQRFNAFSYYVLSQVMDSQDVGRGRGGVIQALSQIKSRTLVMGIKSDALFPINEQAFLAKHIPDATFQSLDSLYGHDGFLIESQLITKAIKLWQKFIRFDVNPMYDFFKGLEKKVELV